MRGRRPKPFAISSDVERTLRGIARDVARPYFEVVRARILLARASGQRVKNIADKFQVDESLVWRIVNNFSVNGFRSLRPKAPRSVASTPDLKAPLRRPETHASIPPRQPEENESSSRQPHLVEIFGIDWG